MPTAARPRCLAAHAAMLIGLVALLGALALSAVRVVEPVRTAEAAAPGAATIEQVVAHHPVVALRSAVVHRTTRHVPALVAVLLASLGAAMAIRSFMLTAESRPRRERSVVVEPGLSRAPPVVLI